MFRLNLKIKKAVAMFYLRKEKILFIKELSYDNVLLTDKKCQELLVTNQSFTSS